jgi:hypothetical protein
MRFSTVAHSRGPRGRAPRRCRQRIDGPGITGDPAMLGGAPRGQALQLARLRRQALGERQPRRRVGAASNVPRRRLSAGMRRPGPCQRGPAASRRRPAPRREASSRASARLRHAVMCRPRSQVAGPAERDPRAQSRIEPRRSASAADGKVGVRPRRVREDRRLGRCRGCGPDPAALLHAARLSSAVPRLLSAWLSMSWLPRVRASRSALRRTRPLRPPRRASAAARSCCTPRRVPPRWQLLQGRDGAQTVPLRILPCPENQESRESHRSSSPSRRVSHQSCSSSACCRAVSASGSWSVR